MDHTVLIAEFYLCSSVSPGNRLVERDCLFGLLVGVGERDFLNPIELGRSTVKVGGTILYTRSLHCVSEKTANNKTCKNPQAFILYVF